MAAQVLGTDEALRKWQLVSSWVMLFIGLYRHFGLACLSPNLLTEFLGPCLGGVKHLTFVEGRKEYHWLGQSQWKTELRLSLCFM